MRPKSPSPHDFHFVQEMIIVLILLCQSTRPKTGRRVVVRTRPRHLRHLPG